MSLQWNQDLESVIRRAQIEAQRYASHANSAILLKSLLDSPCSAGQILRQIGLSQQAFDYALSHYQFRGEPQDMVQRLIDRAARLASCSREDEIRPGQLLLAILDEPCMAHALLQALNLDIELARNLVYGYGMESQATKYQGATHAYAMHRSMGTPASQKKSPTLIPVTTFSPGCDPTVDFIPAIDRQNTWVSPETPQTSTTAQIGHQNQRNLASNPIQNKAATPPTTSTAKPSTSSAPSQRSPKTTQSSKKILSARESQQATAIDLAKRIQLKKSQENLAVAPKPISKNTALERPQTGIENQRRETQESVRPKSKPSLSPIINRRTVQREAETQVKSANSPSVLVRKKSTLPNFNPFSLNPSKFPNLCRFGRNLLAEARAGKLEPVIERDKEMEQLVDILNKRRSNNPVLVGESGVGKTVIIEGLAYNMAHDKVPQGLEQHTIVSLDYGSFMSGTQLRGAIQDRINAIKSELKQANGQIILFLDEIHCWLGSNNGDSNADLSGELKIAMARNELNCIGATTNTEYRRVVDADPALERRFDVIEVKAPDVKTSIRIIQNGIIEHYAAHHEVTYTNDAIVSAVKLSERFIKERTLPDKAISVLDRAGSITKRAGKKKVNLEAVASVIAQLAEIPIEKLLMTENERLVKMESLLAKKLIGHSANIEKIAQVIRRNHAGFGAHRPIGSFLFLGPTGVGKTEAAKVLADFLFGSPNDIVRFDMSEFMEQHSVAKLIGAPAGYVGFDDGGLLTEALRKHPYQIVLFDEIEKAHPDVTNILLQILDEGRLSDAKGRHIDFSNTVIIMTSNLGVAGLAKAAEKSIGFGASSEQMSEEEAENIILKGARSHFSPELWNRIEEKLIFHPLTLEEIRNIAALLLKDSADRLFCEKKILLHFDSELIDYLLDHGGYNPAYGARPMRRTIQSLVESRIAEWILTHENCPQNLSIYLDEAGSVAVSEQEP